MSYTKYGRAHIDLVKSCRIEISKVLQEERLSDYVQATYFERKRLLEEWREIKTKVLPCLKTCKVFWKSGPYERVTCNRKCRVTFMELKGANYQCFDGTRWVLLRCVATVLNLGANYNMRDLNQARVLQKKNCVFFRVRLVMYYFMKRLTAQKLEKFSAETLLASF